MEEHDRAGQVTYDVIRCRKYALWMPDN